MTDPDLNEWLDYIRLDDLPFEARPKFNEALTYYAETAKVPVTSRTAPGLCISGRPREVAEFLALRETIVWMHAEMLIGDRPGEFEGAE